MKSAPVLHSCFRAAACGALVFASLCAASLRAQEPEIPEGYVLIDDMILPESAVNGDSTWTATAWPGGVVPWALGAGTTTFQQYQAIAAMTEISNATGVQFVPWNQLYTNRIVFLPATGNNSPVGMIGGAQFVNIFNWNQVPVISHEIIHALGYLHEQSRPDRANYVTINTQFIQPAYLSNFNLFSTANVVGPYDFASVMQYDECAFSTDCAAGATCGCTHATISCLPAYASYQHQMGQRQGLSVLDVLGIQARYGAAPAPTVASISPTGAPAGQFATILVVGSHFLRGSSQPNLLTGSTILINGSPVPTTFVDDTTLRATNVLMPATPQCLSIAVQNAYPGGGTSVAISLNVYDQSTFPANTWQGHDASEYFGLNLAALGDVNGDGVPDFAIAAPLENAGAGRVHVIDGATGQVLWFRAGGPAAQLGMSIANVGDVTGDGVNDLAVGAPGVPLPSSSVLVLNGVDGAVIRGMNGLGNDGFGSAVSTVGDVDGDGVPDIAVGSPTHAGFRGNVTIFSGATGAYIRTHFGNAPGELFGQRITGGISLVSGGGPNYAIASPDANVYPSSHVGTVTVFNANGSILAILNGAAGFDGFGQAVCLMESTDERDGGTLAVGATQRSNGFGPAGTGYVNLYAWDPNTGVHLTRTIPGSAPGDAFGQSIAPAGDLDQDGYEELLIGANQPGAGSPTGPGYLDVWSDARGLRLLRQVGTQFGSEFGRAAVTIGDTDGDARPNILIGAPRFASGCPYVGQVRQFQPDIAPSRTKVMITEVAFGSTFGVELSNFAPWAIDATDWHIQVRTAAGTFTSQRLFHTLDHGETAVAHQMGQPFVNLAPVIAQLEVLPTIAAGNGPIVVALVAENGLVVDEVRISATDGPFNLPGLGGMFRGLARRGLLSAANGQSGSVERIWGLDSNSGADWTDQPVNSIGLENQNSGPRGTDPIAIQSVVINETDDTPTYVEFKNIGTSSVDLTAWTVWGGAIGWTYGVELQPWVEGIPPLGPGGFTVIGDGSPPPEMPGAVWYVDYALHGFGYHYLPWYQEAYGCALYDNYGRLVDLMRTTGDDDAQAFNFPRAPANWSDFGGVAGRNTVGSRAIGRDALSTDTNRGSDFRPINVRSMGTANTSFAGPAGTSDILDVRLDGTGVGTGLAIVINAGAAHAGELWSFSFSLGHQGGLGPVFGLGIDALDYYPILVNTPGWHGQLDAQGAARVDLPPYTLPQYVGVDAIFILQNAMSAVTQVTKVITLDTY